MRMTRLIVQISVLDRLVIWNDREMVGGKEPQEIVQRHSS